MAGISPLESCYNTHNKRISKRFWKFGEHYFSKREKYYVVAIIIADLFLNIQSSKLLSFNLKTYTEKLFISIFTIVFFNLGKNV